MFLREKSDLVSTMCTALCVGGSYCFESNWAAALREFKVWWECGQPHNDPATKTRLTSAGRDA